MFERFTHRARQVIMLAQEEAKRLHHTAVGTEHVLLGIIREGEGVASKALESLNISQARVRANIEGAIGRGELPPHEEAAFTPRAKKVLELALDEARGLGHNYIGTEHLLLGLISEGDGVAARTLKAFGAELDRVRAQVVYLLGEDRTTPRKPDNALADRFQEFAQAVTDSADLSDDLRKTLLEHVSYLGEQAVLPESARQLTVIRTVVGALDQLLANASRLQRPWQAVKALLETTLPDTQSLPKHARFLWGLPDRVRTALAARLRRRTFRKGAMIFHKDRPADALYMVESGRIRTFLPAKEGQELTVDVLGPGDCFGEMALLAGRPSSASAEALEDTVVYTLTRKALWRHAAALLDDRFRLLTGGGRPGFPRHQTLRAAMDWSYGLLSEPERVLLRRLAVFSGGFTLKAAETVCSGAGIETSDVVGLLAQLVDKFLVTAAGGDVEVEYSLLDSVREYALEKLSEAGEASEYQARHRDFFHQ